MDTFRTPRRSARLALATAITVAAALTGPVSQAASTSSGAASPGAAGLGDPIFPLDGNGGYEVSRYTLDFDWQAPKTPFEASTTIKATATQALSRFNLDFAGNTLHEVTVNGRPAATVRDGDELVITPRAPSPGARPSRSRSPTPPTPPRFATATTPSRTTAGSRRPTARCSIRSPTAPR